MPTINDDNLDSIILDLNSRTNTNSIERQKLREIYNNAISIVLKPVPDPIPEDPQRMGTELPPDAKLGTMIDVERRQEIYDKVMADIAELDGDG